MNAPRCRCPSCAPDPARSFSREWLHECEARYLLRLPLSKRRQELAAPERAARRALLEDLMQRLWAADRENAAPRAATRRG